MNDRTSERLLQPIAGASKLAPALRRRQLRQMRMRQRVGAARESGGEQVARGLPVDQRPINSALRSSQRLRRPIRPATRKNVAVNAWR
jgi:hypothetical protein